MSAWNLKRSRLPWSFSAVQSFLARLSPKPRLPSASTLSSFFKAMLGGFAGLNFAEKISGCTRLASRISATYSEASLSRRRGSGGVCCFTYMPLADKFQKARQITTTLPPRIPSSEYATSRKPSPQEIRAAGEATMRTPKHH